MAPKKKTAAKKIAAKTTKKAAASKAKVAETTKTSQSKAAPLKSKVAKTPKTSQSKAAPRKSKATKATKAATAVKTTKALQSRDSPSNPTTPTTPAPTPGVRRSLRNQGKDPSPPPSSPKRKIAKRATKDPKISKGKTTLLNKLKAKKQQIENGDSSSEHSTPKANAKPLKNIRPTGYSGIKPKDEESPTIAAQERKGKGKSPKKSAKGKTAANTSHVTPSGAVGKRGRPSQSSKLAPKKTTKRPSTKERIPRASVKKTNSLHNQVKKALRVDKATDRFFAPLLTQAQDSQDSSDNKRVSESSSDDAMNSEKSAELDLRNENKPKGKKWRRKVTLGPNGSPRTPEWETDDSSPASNQKTPRSKSSRKRHSTPSRPTRQSRPAGANFSSGQNSWGSNADVHSAASTSTPSINEQAPPVGVVTSSKRKLKELGAKNIERPNIKPKQKNKSNFSPLDTTVLDIPLEDDKLSLPFNLSKYAAVVAIPFKGRGVLSLLPHIPAGSILFAERSLLEWNNESDQSMLSAYNALSKYQLRRLRQLAPSGGSAEMRARTNYWSPDMDNRPDSRDASEEIVSVFWRASFFNHSCMPNCDIEVHAAQGVRVRTTVDIPLQGTELTLCYLAFADILNATRARRTLLRNWDFDCICEACGPLKQRVNDNASRARVRALKRALDVTGVDEESRFRLPQIRDQKRAEHDVDELAELATNLRLWMLAFNVYTLGIFIWARSRQTVAESRMMQHYYKLQELRAINKDSWSWPPESQGPEYIVAGMKPEDIRTVVKAKQRSHWRHKLHS
ncbi:hypothetical protein BT63DRAFT_43523 [Microthyrium microscopicum]|uniref:SET domain-containing protein n=1 Tax=Microthyrium microscopicum TaxID=703497 RepID=A0A6A6U1W4_9PEZI|nr:hypothetical protein BT63DRAFT_43523 [Microthyrium microscopicum]